MKKAFSRLLLFGALFCYSTLTAQQLGGERSKKTPVTWLQADQKNSSVCGGQVDMVIQNGFPFGFLFNSPSIEDVTWAEDFEIVQNNTTLDAITVQAVPSNFSGGFTATTYADVQVRIFSDNGGFPGTEIHSETVSGPFFVNISATPLNIRLSNSPGLAPGIYWVNITSDSGDTPAIFSLIADPVSPILGSPMRVKAGSCPESGFGNCGGIATNYNLLAEFEFCLAPPEVPTLGQWGLIIFGLLILCFGTVAVRNLNQVVWEPQ